MTIKYAPMHDENVHVQISLAQTSTIRSETCVYPLSNLVSDTGGSAGLFLGLNCIGQYAQQRFILLKIR